MKLKRTVPLCAVVLLVANFLQIHFLNTRAADQPVGADGSGAFATGKYRNLFAEAGHSQKEIRQKIESAFQQLFHGEPNSQAVFYEAGTNANGLLAFVTDIKHKD